MGSATEVMRVEQVSALTRAEQYALSFLGNDEWLVSGFAGEKILKWFEQTGREYFLRGCDPQVFVERAPALEVLVVAWIRQQWDATRDKPDPNYPNLAAAFKECPEIQLVDDGLDGLMKRLTAADRLPQSARRPRRRD